MFRKRRASAVSPPQRTPHPDPPIEAALQRIISLRAAVRRKEELLASDHMQIAGLRDNIYRRSWSSAAPTWKGQVEDLLRETRALDAEIAKLHDEIGRRIAALTDTDLAYLGPAPDA